MTAAETGTLRGKWGLVVGTIIPVDGGAHLVA